MKVWTGKRGGWFFSCCFVLHITSFRINLSRDVRIRVCFYQVWNSGIFSFSKEPKKRGFYIVFREHFSSWPIKIEFLKLLFSANPKLTFWFQHHVWFSLWMYWKLPYFTTSGHVCTHFPKSIRFSLMVQFYLIVRLWLQNLVPERQGGQLGGGFQSKQTSCSVLQRLFSKYFSECQRQTLACAFAVPCAKSH